MTENRLPTSRCTDGTVTVHPPGLEIIETMTRNGHPISAIAKSLGMSTRILRECRKRQPEVEEAFAVGLGGLEQELVHTLLAAARKGNVAAAMFLLKCRHGYRETGNMDAGTKVAVQINLPAPMNMDDYAKVVHQEASSDDE